MKYSLLFIILFVCFSCSKTPNQTISSVLETKYLSDQPFFKYDDPTAYKIIPLETTAESLIGSIDKIMLTDSALIILENDNSTITIFNTNGRFRSKISSKGRGPKEYNSLGDITIYNDTIFLLDYGQRKIQKFDYDGEWVGTDNLVSYRGMEFEKADGNDYVFYIHTSQLDDNNSEALYTNNLGNIKKAFIPRKDENIKSISNANYFSKNSNGIYFVPILNDKIYRISNKELEEVYDMGIINLMGWEEKDKYSYIYDLKVCDNNVVSVSTTLNNKPIDIILDIDNNKARMTSNILVRGVYKNYFIASLYESDIPILSDETILTMMNSNENPPIVLIDTEKIIW